MEMRKQVLPLFEYKLEIITKYSLGFKFLYLKDEILKPENLQCSFQCPIYIPILFILPQEWSFLLF